LNRILQCEFIAFVLNWARQAEMGTAKCRSVAGHITFTAFVSSAPHRLNLRRHGMPSDAQLAELRAKSGIDLP
jgi:hypothetical protein